MSVPASRTLEAVLLDVLAPSDGVRLLVGTYGVPLTGTDASLYGNVTLNGATLKIPKLKGTPDGSPGQPAYVLAAPGRMLLLGTVST